MAEVHIADDLSWLIKLDLFDCLMKERTDPVCLLWGCGLCLKEDTGSDHWGTTARARQDSFLSL